MTTLRTAGILLAVLLTGCVTGCGGGGSSGGASGTTSTGASSGGGQQTQPPAISYSLSRQSISVQGDTAGPPQQPITIDWTINNWDRRPSGVTMFNPVKFDGPPISSVLTTSLTTSADEKTITGRITIGLYQASTLGAGTYSGTVTFGFCFGADANNCTDLSAGAPTTIPVTFTVTGAAKSALTFFHMPSALTTEATSADAAGPTRIIELGLGSGYGIPLYTAGVETGAHLVSAVQLSSQNGSLVKVAVNFVPPTQLPLGTYTSNLAIKVCVDSACQHELADSPIQMPLTYSITASEGHDYTHKVVAVVARDLAWSESHQLIYAVVSASSTLQPKTLIAIDPRSATISGSVALAGNPQVLSLSDDGAYAYIGFADVNVVQRINLATLSSDAVISLGTDSTSAPRYASALKVRPGQSHSFAVSEYVLDQYSDPTITGVALFDDATPRAAIFTAMNGARGNSLAWNATGSALYVEDSANYGLFTLTVSSAGLTQSSVAPAVIIFSDILCVNQTIYGAARIADPIAGTMQTITTPDFPAGVPFALDPTAHHAYYFYQDDNVAAYPVWTLGTYDLQARTILVKARLGAAGEYARVIHWGTQGVARSTTQGLDLYDGAWLASGP